MPLSSGEISASFCLSKEIFVLMVTGSIRYHIDKDSPDPCRADFQFQVSAKSRLGNRVALSMDKDKEKFNHDTWSSLCLSSVFYTIPYNLLLFCRFSTLEINSRCLDLIGFEGFAVAPNPVPEGSPTPLPDPNRKRMIQGLQPVGEDLKQHHQYPKVVLEPLRFSDVAQA